MPKKHRLTARLTSSARIRDFDGCLGAKALADHVRHKNETQLTTKPQSSARYGKLIKLLVGQQVHHDDAHENSETVAAGMLRNGTL